MEADPQAIAEVPKGEVPVAEGEMAVLEGAVLLQVLGLKLDQPVLIVRQTALGLQQRVEPLVRLRAAPLLSESERHCRQP